MTEYQEALNNGYVDRHIDDQMIRLYYDMIADLDFLLEEGLIDYEFYQFRRDEEYQILWDHYHPEPEQQV